MQEIRKDAFDEMRRGCNLQHAGVAAPQRLRPLADGAGMVQQAAAIAEQLLAFAGQQEAASDAIEKVQTEFVLKIDDLPGQSGLGDVKAQGSLGHGAEFRHGNEGSNVPQVHAAFYARLA